MLKNLIMGSLVLCSLLVLPQSIKADDPIILTPKQYISLYASNDKIEKQLLAVAQCESKFNINAIHYNDGGKGKHSVGIFQYQKQTFDSFSDLMGEDLDYYSYADQAKLTAWIFANYPKLKSHWTCSKITKIV